MKTHSKIIRGFGLSLLLFVLVSAVAISEDTNGGFTDTVAVFGNDSVWTGNEGGMTPDESTNDETSDASVTVVENPPSEGVDDTVDDTNTAESTDPEGGEANGNPDPGIVPPNSNPDELTHEEWGIDEWWEWILSATASEDITLPPLPPVEDTIDFTTIGDF